VTQLAEGPFGRAGRAGAADAGPGPLGIVTDLVRDGGVVLLSVPGCPRSPAFPTTAGDRARAAGRADDLPDVRGRRGAGSGTGRAATSGGGNVARAAPNAGHHAVAELEQARAGGRQVITQNVDGPARRRPAPAQSSNCTQPGRVFCLAWRQRTAALSWNERLHAANPGWLPVRRPRGARRSRAARATCRHPTCCAPSTAAGPPRRPRTSGRSSARPAARARSARVVGNAGLRGQPGNRSAALPRRPDQIRTIPSDLGRRPPHLRGPPARRALRQLRHPPMLPDVPGCAVHAARPGGVPRQDARRARLH